jgi:hypothetical protein
MPIDEEELYKEIGRAWLHYVTWREKIFGGYLTVLAALAYEFETSQGDHIRAALFAAVLLVSIVFRLLDYRTTALVNLCQSTGENLSGLRGLFGQINQRRFAKTGSISYATALDLLVR